MRLELLLNHNAKEVNDEKYDVIAKVYYKQFEVLFKDTPYERMAEIFNDRQAHINENIINIIKENIGKRILFITGIDHRAFIIDAIKNNIKEDIKFAKVEV